MKYSEVQQQAIEKHEGQVILISCPGSGKTSTVVARVADMVESGIHPSEILVVTFTTAAAKEMKERYQSFVSDRAEADEATFCTIHSFCFQILRQWKGLMTENITSEHEELDWISQDVQKLRRSGALVMEIRDYWEFIRSCRSEISKVANNPYHDWASYQPEVCNSTEAFHQIYDDFQQAKEGANKIDFDDMLIMVNDLFDKNPALLESCQSQYRYLIVDEYQDTNFLQRDLLYKLAGENPNLCVVGDDDQSIYRFRGAKPEIMLGFKETFPDCTELFMDVNYRSRPEIVRAAKNVISYNEVRFQKDIKPSREEGGKVKRLSFDTKDDEYQAIADRIKLVHKSGVAYEDMAILFRINDQVQGWASTCMAEGIPFHSTERVKNKYDAWMFKDILAYWHLANGDGTLIDMLNVINKPNRFLPAGKFKSFDQKEMTNVIKNMSYDEEWKRTSALDQISTFFSNLRSLKDQTPSDFLMILRKIVGYNAYLKKYAAFRNQDYDDYKTIMDFYEEEAAGFDTLEEWQARIDQYGEKIKRLNEEKAKSGVLLSTMHKAKGLEWKAVFVVHANKDIIPFAKAKSPEDIEEERRLFYVAITRAKDELYISSYGPYTSRFVRESLQEASMEDDSEKEKKRSVKRKDTVKHGTYGLGTVLDVQGTDILVKYRDSAQIIRHSGKDLDSGVLTIVSATRALKKSSSR